MHIYHSSYDPTALRRAKHIHAYTENSILALAGQVHRYLHHEAKAVHVVWMDPQQFIATRNTDPYQQRLASSLRRPHAKPWHSLTQRTNAAPQDVVGCPAAYLPSSDHIIAIVGPPHDPGQLAALTHALAEACMVQNMATLSPQRAPAPRKKWFAPTTWFHLAPKSDKLLFVPRAATLTVAQIVWGDRQNKPLTQAFLIDTWRIPERIVRKMGDPWPTKNSELLPALAYYRGITS